MKDDVCSCGEKDLCELEDHDRNIFKRHLYRLGIDSGQVLHAERCLGEFSEEEVEERHEKAFSMLEGFEE